MNSTKKIHTAFCLLLSTIAVLAANSPPLEAHLEPLRPLLDKTWKGEFKSSTAEKPIVDVSRWERALNGNAVRMVHSINDGVYGGESLFLWDEQKQTIAYYYFTTAGFRTVGTLTIKDGKFMTSETIQGNADSGITEVRGTCELLPEGGFHVKSEHLKNGQWSPGHEVTYLPAPDAKVNFK
jgi:hypothetical protein